MLAAGGNFVIRRRNILVAIIKVFWRASPGACRVMRAGAARLYKWDNDAGMLTITRAMLLGVLFFFNGRAVLGI